MTTQTLTLTEFLLARLAEDEEVARDAAGWDREGRTRANGRWSRVGIASLEDDEGRSVIYSDADQLSGSVADHIARHDPARALADVEAKRRIVEVAMPGERDDAGERGRILRILASVYADHPDYRQEWRP